MLIGVISDSHDNLRALERALADLKARGVELVLHAGDIVSPFVATAFAKAGLRVIGVFGNNDGDKLYLQERFSPVGELHFGPYELELGERRIVMMHEPRCLDSLIASGNYDLVIYGHTHEVDLRPGRPLVLNPGELGGWLSGRSSYAIVDLEKLAAEIITL